MLTDDIGVIEEFITCSPCDMLAPIEQLNRIKTFIEESAKQTDNSTSDAICLKCGGGCPHGVDECFDCWLKRKQHTS